MDTKLIQGALALALSVFTFAEPAPAPAIDLEARKAWLEKNSGNKPVL